MTTKTYPRAFDFTEVLELSEAFQRPSPPRNSKRSTTPPSPSPLYDAHLYNPKSSAPDSLGDLNRLWIFLDKPFNIPSGRRHEPIESSSSLASDKSTPPSSVPEDRPDIEELIGKGKEVRWTDEVSGSKIADFRRHSTQDSSFDLDPALKAPGDDDSDVANSIPSRHTRSRRQSRAVPRREIASASEFESEVEIAKPLPSRRQRVQRIIEQAAEAVQAQDASNTILIPSWVTPETRPNPTKALWVPPAIPKITRRDPSVIYPIYTLTRKEKYAKISKKLQKAFGPESEAFSHIKLDQAMKVHGRKPSPDGLHIFVDCSNIVIGFVNELKMRRGIDVNVHVRKAAISWHALALVLERGRPVTRRVLAGSHGSPLDERQMKRPDYMIEAEKYGYEVNVLDRVLKNKDPTPTKKRGGNGNGYATASGYSSGSDGTYMRKAVAEQAVDEILHMKMLESLVDTKEPSTLVLASGDAAEAEYSGGFLKNVERALTLGWKVEIVAWSSGLSKEYTSEKFLRRWKGQFSIITLDDFSEELLAVYPITVKAPKGVRDLFDDYDFTKDSIAKGHLG